MKLLDKEGLTYYTGKIKNELTDYVKNTDYATSTKGGVIKVQDTLGLGIGSTGNLFATTKSYSTYQTLADGLVISKGTLENVITGKGLVDNTSWATNSKGGVFKTSNTNYATYVDPNNGVLSCETKNYNTYLSASGNLFVSKGTLENVLTARIGDINSVLDAINGEVI